MKIGIFYYVETLGKVYFFIFANENLFLRIWLDLLREIDSFLSVFLYVFKIGVFTFVLDDEALFLFDEAIDTDFDSEGAGSFPWNLIVFLFGGPISNF